MNSNINYYLSFDCATKTFAYVLVKINTSYCLKDIISKINIILNSINNFEENKKKELIEKFNERFNDVITIISSDCVDLIPNKNNKDINTVERVKIVTKYVNENIFPLLKDINNDLLSILIEFQMSHNTQSKIVSIILITLFSNYDKIILIKPTLKNKISLNDEGKYSNFISKYKNNYTANKKHVLYNFKLFEYIFNKNINMRDKLKENIADSFMQILGYIIF